MRRHLVLLRGEHVVAGQIVATRRAQSSRVASILSGFWEFFLRICYVSLLRRSLRRAAKVVSDTLEQYEADETFDANRVAVAQAEHSVKMAEAKAQVACQDLCGDMVVEYVGANVAMLLMVYFGNSPVFAFDCSVTSASLVVAALLAQHVPEVVCDVMSTFCEMSSGMDVMAYLRAQLRWRAVAAKCAYTLASIVWAMAGRLF